MTIGHVVLICGIANLRMADAHYYLCTSRKKLAQRETLFAPCFLQLTHKSGKQALTPVRTFFSDKCLICFCHFFSPPGRSSGRTLPLSWTGHHFSRFAQFLTWSCKRSHYFLVSQKQLGLNPFDDDDSLLKPLHFFRDPCFNCHEGPMTMLKSCQKQFD